MTKKKDNNDFRKLEKFFCLFILMILIILFILSCFNNIFIPATLIMGSLEMFSLGYYFRNNKKKEKNVYILFGIGVILLFISAIYTVINVM